MTFLAALWASQRVKGIVGFIGAALLLIALVAILWRCSVNNEVEEGVAFDRASVEAEIARRQLEAERAATANEQAQAAETARQQEELRDEAAKGDDSDVGPGTRAVLERMRRQQAEDRNRAAAR